MGSNTWHVTVSVVLQACWCCVIRTLPGLYAFALTSKMRCFMASKLESERWVQVYTVVRGLGTDSWLFGPTCMHSARH